MGLEEERNFTKGSVVSSPRRPKTEVLGHVWVKHQDGKNIYWELVMQKLPEPNLRATGEKLPMGTTHVAESAKKYD